MMNKMCRDACLTSPPYPHTQPACHPRTPSQDGSEGDDIAAGQLLASERGLVLDINNGDVTQSVFSLSLLLSTTTMETIFQRWTTPL